MPANPELLRSLSRLTRGLSALFWGMPITLVVCVQTAKGEWMRPLSVFHAVFSNGLLLYALNLLAGFQRQERVWIAAVDRSRAIALVNLGLSPFLFWWGRMPSQPFYGTAVNLLMVFGLMFLFSLNPLLRRLTAMLPDEALRLETRVFTIVNGWLIVATLVLGAAYVFLERFDLWGVTFSVRMWIDQLSLWLLLFLILLPLATTMALLWKIKEVILASVFSPQE